MDKKKLNHGEHIERVNDLADKLLGPESEEVVIRRTPRDIAAEIDLYTNVGPDDDSVVYKVPQKDDSPVNFSEPLVVDRERITYSTDDKKRLLHELGADRNVDEYNTGIERETFIDKSFRRILPSELAAKELEEQEKVEKKTPKAKYKRRRHVLDEDELRARRSMVVLAVVIITALYIGSFFYVRAANTADIEDAQKALLSVSNHQVIKHISKTDSNLSVSDKEKYNLSVYKLDTDEDGLTDSYELLFSATAPAKYDTDGDGVSDGIELLAEINPLEAKTDGITEDAKRTFVYPMEIGPALVSVSGNWEVYTSSVSEYPMSVENYPGILSPGVEITLSAANPSGHIYFDSEKIKLDKWGSNPDLKIFRYNPEDGSMSLAGNGGTVSDDGAGITADVSSGIYFLADRNFLSATSGVNIMFVIDNSGSMYPETMVVGSEENDINFERVDFAENIINNLNEKVNFGVAKFTLRYSTLAPISDDDNAALTALESIKTTDENFDGTEISNSIIRAVDEFEDYKTDHNYIIAITDGLPTNADPLAEERAIKYAQDKNISVITIGLGKKIDPEFLSQIAEETGGVYYQAVNSGTFDSINGKIESLLYAGRTETIQDDTGEGSKTPDMNVLVIADSGFVVSEDTLSAKDIPTTHDPKGSDLGMAVFAAAYYSGTLNLSEAPYTTNSGARIPGYNLSQSEFFVAGKQNLSELVLPKTELYGNYLKVTERWDFDEIADGVLPLSVSSIEALGPLTGFYQVLTTPYDWGGGRDIPGFLRAITFQPQRVFSDYEYPALDIDTMAGENSDEFEVYTAVNYFNNYADKGGVSWLSFGIDGQGAFDELVRQLTLGIPAVLVADGRSFNAAKLTRSQEDSSLYIIECYDPTDGSLTPTYIHMKSVALINDDIPFQYSASISKNPVNLYLCRDE
ncbi:MAG: VWA domain-containing protein [Ruminococcus sp.]|jgi:hypothetical protein|nr:VWA domain-containing protein [Ruminococcus sp.]